MIASLAEDGNQQSSDCWNCFRQQPGRMNTMHDRMTHNDNENSQGQTRTQLSGSGAWFPSCTGWPVRLFAPGLAMLSG